MAKLKYNPLLSSKLEEAGSSGSGPGAFIPVAEKGAPNGVATLDANGHVPLGQIPPTALERVYIYAGAATLPENAGLTIAQVQNGDVVKIMSTGLFYAVVDDTQLNNAAGFAVYNAGTAASVPWSGVTGTPTTLAGYGITDGIRSLNGLTGNIQTFATETSGTSLVFSSSGSVHTLRVPLAASTGTVAGVISNTDYLNFSGKMGGTIATNQVGFGGAANTLAGAAQFTWDNTNKYLTLSDTVAAPTPLARIYLVNEQDSAATMFIDRYSPAGAQTSVIAIRKARGTYASPSAVQANEGLGGLSFRGYGTTGFSAVGRATIFARAGENWTDTAQGAYLEFILTPNGGTTSVITTMNADSLVSSATTYSLLNTTTTTVNAFQAATAIIVGATSGTFTLRNPTLVGTQTTQSIFNTVATTGNILGAATSITMGATTGTATIRNATVALSGGTLTGAATQNLFNTVSTTVNAFGAATTANIAGTTATSTINIGAGATIAAATKTINIGINGVSTSITNINIGSAVAGATGTTTIGGTVFRLLNATATTSTFSTAQMLVRASTGNVEAIAASGGGTTNFLRADGTWAAPAGGGGGTISTLFTATATQSVTNTPLEGTLMSGGVGSKTIGANTMQVGTIYRITVSGSLTALAGQAITIRVKFGSTTIVTTNSNNLGTVNGTRMFRLSSDITVRSTGAGGTVIGSGVFAFSNTSSIAGILWELEAQGGNGTTSNIDTTVAQVIDVTAQWGSANPSNSIGGYNVSIEKLN